MIKRLLLITVLFLPLALMAQDETGNNFGIKFSGFVKNDFFWDSRQTIAAREGHFMLFPAPENPDAEDEDINSNPSFNFLAIQSRLSGKITGPDAFGAKTSGLIEGDFFAQANDNINLFRMRHAFVKLSWTNVELLLGQYWNPMFVTSCFPGTVSFNTGAPIQPFARNPQVRITFKSGNLRILAAALSQRDYVSRVTNDASGISSQYLRNSAIPDMHLQVHYDAINSETKTGVVAGVGGAFKKIVPSLTTPLGYKTNNGVTGITAIGFVKAALAHVTIKFETVYGQNIADVLSISGFAISNTTPDATTGAIEYTPLNTLSFWTDIHSNNKNVQVGVFAGFTQNMGASEEIVAGSIVGFGTNIKSLMRISPRIIFNSGKFRLAGEIEYTSANYMDLAGTNPIDEKGVIQDTYAVSNIRALIGVYYFF